MSAKKGNWLVAVLIVISIGLTLVFIGIAQRPTEVEPSSTELVFVDGGTNPEPPYQSATLQPPRLPRTSLDLRISVLTNTIAPVPMQLANGRTDVLGLPIRIENRSSSAITATIAHEWYGGEWPVTDLGAAVRRIGGPVGGERAAAVYLVGEVDDSGAMEWQPGQSRDFLLRMNWPGTGSVMGWPLIETGAAGKYGVKFSLVFKAGTSSEFFASPEFKIYVEKKRPD